MERSDIDGDLRILLFQFIGHIRRIGYFVVFFIKEWRTEVYIPDVVDEASEEGVSNLICESVAI